jgi:hypothetical protein
VETASEILAEQFRGNPEIEKRIIAIASERHVPTSVIMALALGWRSSDLLKEIEFDLNPADVRASELYTKYAVAKAERIPSIIEADLVWARLNKYQTTMLVKPLIARLRFDPLVAEYCFAYVKLASNPDVKVSFPRILAAAGEMTAERAAWCREELERQQAIESPEFGFDVLAQTPRSLYLCLLDSLGETTSFASQLTPDS